jgi:hypothetical protein
MKSLGLTAIKAHAEQFLRLASTFSFLTLSLIISLIIYYTLPSFSKFILNSLIDITWLWVATVLSLITTIIFHQTALFFFRRYDGKNKR